MPLWIAFALATRPASRRFTYGYGRVEDLAGVFVVAMITLSAIVAGYEAIQRLIHPQVIEHVGWVALAGLVGFIGNETVAIYRIRVGWQIGSAALAADGIRARTDGFTALAGADWRGWCGELTASEDDCPASRGAGLTPPRRRSADRRSPG